MIVYSVDLDEYLDVDLPLVVLFVFVELFLTAHLLQFVSIIQNIFSGIVVLTTHSIPHPTLIMSPIVVRTLSCPIVHHCWLFP